jgi:hypothetical protein
MTTTTTAVDEVDEVDDAWSECGARSTTSIDDRRSTNDERRRRGRGHGGFNDHGACARRCVEREARGARRERANEAIV